MTQEPVLTRQFRFFALALAALGTLAAVLELWLIGHTNGPAQLAPFALAGLTALGIVAVLLNPTVAMLRAFQVAMLLLLAGSLIGVAFHLRANLEVIREISPDLSGLGLVWGMLTGSAPVLAPGMLAQVGLLGLAFTFRHPAFRTSSLHALETEVRRSRLAAIRTANPR